MSKLHLESLLDYLTYKVGCSFVIDLYNPLIKQLLVSHLEQIQEDAFPPREWKDAPEYLAGSSQTAEGKTAKEQLIRALKEESLV